MSKQRTWASNALQQATYMSKVMTLFPLDSFIILRTLMLSEEKAHASPPGDGQRTGGGERCRREEHGAATGESSTEQQLATDRTILNQRNGLMALLAPHAPQHQHEHAACV